MRIHELVADHDVVIVHREGYMRTLTPQGALYDTMDTEDLLNLSIACGVLLSDCWELATPEQIAEFEVFVPDRLMSLQWAEVPTRPKPKLTVVK